MQRRGSSWDVSLDRWDHCRHCGVSGPSGKLLLVEAAVCDQCTVSVEKRIREEQSWQLQKTFQDSLFRFRDWLWAAEGMAACPNSSQVSYACSKKELQKFEGLQRQIADKLLPLETLNRQYHQLARNGHGGAQLRSTIQEINQRWDALKIRTAAIYKRLKHFVNQREEFELERETIRIWLMELDLRLTDVEHFSGGTALEKMIQLQAFRQDVQANAERVDHLLVRGELLIQKSQPEDAEILEEELQDLSSFCQEVFRRVFCFRWRLVSIRLVFENEWLSDQDSDVESDCFTESSLDVAADGETILPLPPSEPGSQSTPKRTSRHHQQVDPNLGGIMDLEWDPSVDVGGSTSHEEEDSSYYSTITGVEPWEEPSPRCRSFPREPLYPLPLPCSGQEDSLGDAWPRAFQEQWEHLRCPLPDEEAPTCSSDKFGLWGLDGFQHPQDLPLEKGAGCQIEPLGFDPKRIESWLGQTCQEKTEVQGTGALPASEWHFSGRSQTSKRRAQKIKAQQPFRRKARLPPRDGAKTGQISQKRWTDSCTAPEVAVEEGLPAPYGVSSQAQKLRRTSALLSRTLLSAFALLLLLLAASASLLALPEPSCLQANSYTSSFHLVLKYINGPPPT